MHSLGNLDESAHFRVYNQMLNEDQ